jgi:hypothetical protein
MVVFGPVYGQKPDSIGARYDSLAKAKLSKLDSTSNDLNNKIDSVQGRMNRILNPDLRLKAPDLSRRSSRDHVRDSLAAIQELDSMKRGLGHKIDSLRSLNLPVDKYAGKLDSLNRIDPANYAQRAQEKIGNLQTKINQPIDGIGQKVNQPVDKVESKINDKLSVINKETDGKSGLPGNVDLGNNVKLPGANLDSSLKTDVDLKLPGADVNVDNPLNKMDNPAAGQMGKVGDVKDKLTGITQAPQEKIDQLKSVDELKNVHEQAGKVNAVTDKAQEYGKEVRSVANEDLGEVKSIPDAIENKAQSLDEIKELQKHQGLGEMDKYKDMSEAAKDPEAAKAVAKQEVIKYARDHFAGQEKALQAGMDQLTKFKEKYPNMPTADQLKKRVYNAMAGKPFIERLIPGFTFQVQKTSNVLIDISPSLSFRISGVWNAGIGWNERISFQKWNQLVPIDRIYGPRAFTSVIVMKGFGVKIEAEKMNTYVPTNPLTTDAGHRDWVWSLFVGIKKDYRISRWINGNIQTLYNLYDDHDNSPYSDRLSVRMGFEIPMKKKVKPAAK